MRLTDLPRTEWVPLLIPNPDRKWWKFWEPKFIWNPENDIVSVMLKQNEIMNDLPWVKVPNKTTD